MAVARRKNSRWCQRRKRVGIYLRDGFTCLYCGTDLRDAAPATLTLDHLEPRLLDDAGKPRVRRCADGRPINDATNLVTACRPCNCSRGAKPWREFAPGGAILRIERAVAQPINHALARALCDGSIDALVADVETR